jgi:hypothetical protein
MILFILEFDERNENVRTYIKNNFQENVVLDSKFKRNCCNREPAISVLHETGPLATIPRLLSQVDNCSPEMRYNEISKEMSSLFFGLDVFCQFEARVPEFDAVFSTQYTLYKKGEVAG